MHMAIRLVQEANPGRTVSNLDRRSMKLVEELGEIAEAYLNVSSSSMSNGKGKTYYDVFEEAADVLIVALDIALTPLTDQERGKNLMEIIHQHFLDMGAFRRVTSREWDDELSFEDLVFDVASGLTSFYEHFRKSNFGSAREIANAMAVAAYTLATRATYSVTLTMDADDNKTALNTEVIRKLKKWADNRAKMAVVTDDV